MLNSETLFGRYDLCIFLNINTDNSAGASSRGARLFPDSPNLVAQGQRGHDTATRPPIRANFGAGVSDASSRRSAEPEANKQHHSGGHGWLGRGTSLWCAGSATPGQAKGGSEGLRLDRSLELDGQGMRGCQVAYCGPSVCHGGAKLTLRA